MTATPHPGSGRHGVSAVDPPGRSSRRPGTPGRVLSPVLVGRDREMRLLERAARTTPALVVVEGEAGVGKSRLIREWLGSPQLAATARLVGRCTDLREPLPFGPVVDALSGAAPWLPGPGALSPVTGVLRPLLPELAHRLPPAPEPAGNPPAERHRVFRGVRDLLAALGPTVLVLEDLHWADEATGELLRFLVGRLPAQLVLVLTYRREDLPDPAAPVPVAAPPAEVPVVRIRLSPLDPSAVADLVAAAYPGMLPPGYARRLHRCTAGLPLAVEELAGVVAARGPGVPLEEVLPQAPYVPVALRVTVRDRLLRAGVEARQLLSAAAVLDRPADEELLARLAALDPERTTAALTELVNRALLRPVDPQRYDFPHALARQAVRELVPEPDRRRLHRRAVEVLRTLDPPPRAELARHSHGAGRFDDWLRYAEAAADEAVGVCDHDTAVALLRPVVAEERIAWPQRVRLATKLAHAAQLSRDPGRTSALLRRLLADSRLSATDRGRLRVCLGLLLRHREGAVRQGRTELERAYAEVGDAPALAARAAAGLGTPHLVDGLHVGQHLTWLERAEQAARRCDDPALLATVRDHRTTALAATGDPAGWAEVARTTTTDGPGSPADAWRLARRAVGLAWAALWVGRYREAASQLRLARRLTTGDRASDSLLPRYLAGCELLYDYAVGRWDGLAVRAEELVAAASDTCPVTAVARTVAGLLALAAGRMREAEVRLAVGAPMVPVMVAARDGLVRAAAAGGDLAAAADQADRAVALVRAKGVWCWAAEVLPTAVGVLARSATGYAAAAALLAEADAGLSGRDSPLAEAALLAGRAALAEAHGDLATAAARYAEAAEAYLALPRPYLAAAAREARGRCLLADGSDGTQAVAEALAAFEQLGATRDVARCRHLLRCLGRRVSHRRGRRGYGSQLSPREREVVRLVRSGLTNREIAESLYLSTRTVEAHVARALRKLGLPSRRALAAGGAEVPGPRDPAEP